MKKQTKYVIFLSLLLTLVIVLTGCGQTLPDYLTNNFSLEDVQGNEKEEGIQKVYRAPDMSVEQVVNKIVDQQQPKEKSDIKDGKAVLVYDDQVISVKKDDSKDKDSLIYVSSYDFVRNNTNSGFWQGYITARALDMLFGGLSIRGPPNYPGGTYKGPWDYQGSTTTDQTVKKPNSISKPGTYDGTGTVTRKSSDGTSSIDSSNYNQSSSKYWGISTKPKTSSGIGRVTRKRR